jgi:hypothetical protein
LSELKLTIELVPASSWADNVRSLVSKKQWDLIRSQVYSKAWNVCEICGGVGRKHPVEAHETWAYDDAKQTQKLVGMVALCPDCHQVKHIGLAQIRGNGVIALKHLMKINKLTKSEAEKYIQQAFQTWDQRSKKDWTLDMSLLKDYGIDPEKIKEDK